MKVFYIKNDEKIEIQIDLFKKNGDLSLFDNFDEKTDEQDIQENPEKYFFLVNCTQDERDISLDELKSRKDWNLISQEIFNLIKQKYEDEKNYMKEHYLGHIEDYSNNDSSYESRSIEDYPVIIKEFFDKTEEKIELRQSGEELKYVKRGEDGEILYEEGDDFGSKEVVYLSLEEIKKKGLPTHDTSVLAFDSKGNNVGLASDEWGADGLWVKRSHQRRGIGTELLSAFRSQFSEDRKHGQMTNDGFAFTKSYFRNKNK